MQLFVTISVISKQGKIILLETIWSFIVKHKEIFTVLIAMGTILNGPAMKGVKFIFGVFISIFRWIVRLWTNHTHNKAKTPTLTEPTNIAQGTGSLRYYHYANQSTELFSREKEQEVLHQFLKDDRK